MNYISSSITFYGNCMKAIEFYKKVFINCKTEIIKYADVAEALNLGDTVKGKEDLIYQATLIINLGGCDTIFTMADSPSLLFLGQSTTPNNIDNLTFVIAVDDSKYLESLYNALIDGGKSNILPRINNLGYLEGSLIDRFGVCWILRTV